MGRFRGSVVAALLLAGVLASTAQADDVSFDFESGTQGWMVESIPFVGEPVFTTPTHLASGGNPLGHIAYTDTDGGDGEAVGFFTPPAGTIGPEHRDATLAYSFKTSLSQPSGIEIRIDATKSGVGPVALTCSPPNAIHQLWTADFQPLTPDNECWKDGIGFDDATAQDFKDVLQGENPVLRLPADITLSAETEYLDTVLLTKREINVKYSKKKQRFSGTVSGEDPGCVEAAFVTLLVETNDAPDFVGQTEANAAGKWKIPAKAKKNKSYYAVSPWGAPGADYCDSASSKTIKPVN